MKNLREIKDPVKELRKMREKVCFPIINRGRLWYDTLTLSQIGELNSWYWKWLNVTETLEIPVMPSWLKNKVNEEEIIL